MKRLPEFLIYPPLAWLALVLVGCGTSSNHCGFACETSGPPDPFLYATTTSNQILGFTISSTGSLTPVAASAGPANSASIAVAFDALLFADSSSNEAAVEQVQLESGALTPMNGSPLPLGSTAGGPNSILLGPAGQFEFFYASEPNGTIVGYGDPASGASAGPLPGSPYAAGIAPTQMAWSLLTGSPAVSLYASDSGDPNGGILAFAIASDGSLSPIAGSPFPTAPNAGPSYLLNVSNNGDQFLFVSLFNAGQIAGFRVDTATGALTPVPGSPFAAGKGPGTLVSGALGNELFVINTLDHAVEAFNFSTNGVLTPLGSPVAVGTASGGIVFTALHSSTGANTANVLYAADAAASSVDIVPVDINSGTISAGAAVSVSTPPLDLAVYDEFPLP